MYEQNALLYPKKVIKSHEYTSSKKLHIIAVYPYLGGHVENKFPQRIVLGECLLELLPAGDKINAGRNHGNCSKLKEITGL